MHINLSTQNKKENYLLLTQLIVPRPIAWVLSDNGNNSYNLAPFSYFSGVCSDPPIVSISVGKKKDGSKKDTWENIEQRKNLVLHIPHSGQETLLDQSAEPLAHGDSELTLTKLDTVAVPDWPLPRLKDAKIALLGKYHQIHLVGNGPQALILIELTDAYISDQILDQDQPAIINQTALSALARIGSKQYSELKH